MKGVFGDCQFTCFPDCQLALPPESAKNLFFGQMQLFTTSQGTDAVDPRPVDTVLNQFAMANHEDK